jgi:Cu/Ag efflux pump CusA
MRYLPQFRNTKEAIQNIRLLAPTGERVSLGQLCRLEERDEGSEIYRESNERYVPIKYSVRDRDLGGAVEAAIQGAVRTLRPIMMALLAATLGMLPAATSHAIGSDSQRPFAIVIVGGLIVDLVMSTFLLPTFYAWWARPTDHLPPPEEANRVNA